MMRKTTLLFLVLMLGPALSMATAEGLVGTLRLNDGLSFISFGDRRIYPIASDATIRFRFGAPTAKGSIPFTISPEDVSIPLISIGSDESLLYSLDRAASGWVHVSEDGGRRIEFTASVAASLQKGGSSGTLTYLIPFTTETASATDSAGSGTVEVAGVRPRAGGRHVQLVGAVVNKENAFPEPGAAVYTILSGEFDQVPW